MSLLIADLILLVMYAALVVLSMGSTLAMVYVVWSASLDRWRAWRGTQPVS